MKQQQSVSAADMARQREIGAALRDTFAQRCNATPLACVNTFGCQQNEADSETIMGMLREMGFSFTRDSAAADVVVVNTCAVREHAQARAYGTLGAMTHTKAARPGQIICLCGCMVQQSAVAEKIKKSYRHVDLVFGPQALWRFPELLARVVEERSRVFSIDSDAAIAEGMPVVRRDRARAFVSVMYGCNNFCSYCIVPYVRGRERSREKAHIVEDVRTLIENGCREITLLGQNVNSYGKTLTEPCTFSELLRELAELNGDFLIRFMTSHPKDASQELIETMAAYPKIAKHLHLPFQSGSTRVLRAMRRGYSREEYMDLVRRVRAAMPDIVLTSDVIVGFPGESEEEFSQTLSLVEELRFDALFTFLYSPRPGTRAAELDDPVPRAEKQVWFDRLLSVQNAISAQKHAAYIGTVQRVLVDGSGGEAPYPLTARTAGGRLVHLAGPETAVGRFCRAAITGSNTWALYGEVAER